jgi:predicted nuclease of restriction endonuclease-like (RecB) superfamily
VGVVVQVVQQVVVVVVAACRRPGIPPVPKPSAQQRAARSVNRELVLLYWQIGSDILARQSREGWGAKVIDRLAVDLRKAFPEMKGFSPRNLKYMRAFAQAWPDAVFVQEVLAQLPWYHQLTLLDKLPTAKQRQWYAAKAIEHNWSRNVLVMQIETRLLERSGQAVSNFAESLPAPLSDLAHESLKDPYLFDFLGLGAEASERALEDAISQHITRFLLELGAGFAYVGRQVPLEVGGDDFFLDLLFYHLRLRCYVVIDLKAGEALATSTCRAGRSPIGECAGIAPGRWRNWP